MGQGESALHFLLRVFPAWEAIKPDDTRQKCRLLRNLPGPQPPDPGKPPGRKPHFPSLLRRRDLDNIGTYIGTYNN